MKKVEINRLEVSIDLMCSGDESEEAFKKYTLDKLTEAGFDLTKSIQFEDEMNTITYTQEDYDATK